LRSEIKFIEEFDKQNERRVTAMSNDREKSKGERAIEGVVGSMFGGLSGDVIRRNMNNMNRITEEDERQEAKDKEDIENRLRQRNEKESEERFLSAMAPLRKYYEDARKQVEEWENKGLCFHCGGKIGFFRKKCKICKKLMARNIRLDFSDSMLANMPNIVVPIAGYDWYVLDIKDGEVLLLSVDIIIKMGYGSGTLGVWNSCRPRYYLNGEFYNNLFDWEKAIISQKSVMYRAIGKYEHTEDNIFLLDLDEFNKYFGEGALRTCVPSRANEAYWWWLRDPSYRYEHKYDSHSYNHGYTVTIDSRTGECDGKDRGIYIANANVGLRPAMWIKIYDGKSTTKYEDTITAEEHES